MKRIFDFFVSGMGLLFLSPFLWLIVLFIVCRDGFPVLFKQVRVGRNGNDFVLYKFRTMSQRSGSEKGSFDAGDSARVTPIGRILRKTKLDEFPQLLNVLKGDMSLVGPRPEVRKWVDAYPDRWAFIHRVRPGITDPASIEFRNEEEILSESLDPENTYRNEILPRKLSLYEDYVQHRSLVGDISIIFKTFLALLR